MTESTLFGLAFILYIVATLFYLAFQFSKKEARAKVGFALASLGFLSHTAALILRTFESHHAPFTNMYESLSFLAWASALAFLVIDRKFKIPRIGAYVLLIVVGLAVLREGSETVLFLYGIAASDGGVPAMDRGAAEDADAAGADAAAGSAAW